MLRSLFLGVCLFLIGLAALIGYKAYEFLAVPPARPGEAKVVFIEPGQSFETTAKMLVAEGALRDADAFRLLARITDKGGKVKAGEFEINTGWTPTQLLDYLTTAKGIQHKLAAPEGLTMRQIARLSEEAGLCSAAAFLKAAADPQLLAKYDIPAPTAEGFLFPNTYLFTRKRGDDGTYVVEAMLKEFRRQADAVWPGETKPTGKDLLAAVTLASIVEKETGVDAERPRVAGVFVNRLAKGMLLQTDPTIIYGLGERFNGNLTRAHLEDTANLYNTYARPGLPPGPICSPGLKSLQAVAAPESHDLYYFVATGEGEHKFSKTLDEHINAVNKYQRGRGRKQ
ncbi:endolytic transglycosylase MltG [Solidesulfovibrio sp.]|uniref:endolytic transglycosylase MltG n=1 Tax=Solidesulfovibrio sp. TaxID=2910990 RepID=UPI0026183361|nr:endolytic transglycosylase MltG [Solidesulfovibrio sp.]